jgi:hypothetical protein
MRVEHRSSDGRQGDASLAMSSIPDVLRAPSFFRDRSRSLRALSNLAVRR